MIEIKTEVKGVIPYLVTPIKKSGEINDKVLGQLCTDLIGHGVHGLTPLGSTGEFAYLDEGQRQRVVEIVMAAASRRVPVIPIVASTSTLNAVAQAKCYQRLGVDGIVVVLEAYFPLTEVEVERYFLSVADAVDIPLIIYTNPNFQRSDLSVDVIEKLSKHPNIVGLKDASTNTGRLLSITNRCGESLDIFAASSHIATCVMLLGGKGWFAGPACVIPRQSVSLYNLCVAQKWSEAIELQKQLWYFNEVFARFNLAACVKTALEQQGYAVGDPILPQSPTSQEGRLAIVEALARSQRFD